MYFIKKKKIVAIYVDNLLIVSTNKNQIKDFKKALNKRFKIINFDFYYFYFNIKVIRNH